MTAPKHAISLEKISIRYTEADGNERIIVTDFSLEVPQGHVHCLAGRSGSGKTWPRAARTSAIRAQLLSSLAPGILLALLSGVLPAVFMGGPDPLPLVLVTFGVPVVAVAITLIRAQRYTRALVR
ncbi:hypothetical protein M3B43_00515 [Nesterenkonia massiliensis]|uniref:ATP-binding cassette domain-containing protein n=1 Tax=Nesterenkonia massiliensis TaxID=1232429 RepID=A0ABT2HMP4_9MICC|nr:hypothetical protein [Nesterenkonia massiliensis]MCT1605824.1 hypothetical protein [Nesterenkonia massiliensis]